LRLPRRHAEIRHHARREKVLPGDSLRAAFELVKGGRLESRHSNQHATRRTEPQIRAHHRARVAAPAYAAVFNLRSLAKRLELAGENRLQPGRGDREAIEWLRSSGSQLTLPLFLTVPKVQAARRGRCRSRACIIRRRSRAE